MTKILRFTNDTVTFLVYKANLSGPVWCVTPMFGNDLQLSQREKYQTRNEAIAAAKEKIKI